MSSLALNMLDHALEYLTDRSACRMAAGGRPEDEVGDFSAITLLSSLKRDLYLTCPPVRMAALTKSADSIFPFESSPLEKTRRNTCRAWERIGHHYSFELN